MNTSLGFLLKILGGSIVLSVLIKTAAPSLGIAATNLNATIAIFAPSLILGIFLLQRGWRAENELKS